MTADPNVVSQALAQVEQGFAAFALLANAKKPITPNGFKDATRKPDWLETQLKAPPAGNYGIVWPTDVPEVVLALDLDNGSDGRERPWQDRMLELIAKIGPLPPTKATTTPSGGRHAFYRWPTGTPVPSGDELFGFTVRWPGRGYLVGPGSSINGVGYLAGPVDEIADLPAPWVDAATAARPPRRNGTSSTFITVAPGAYELPDSIPAGRRYATVRDYVASRYNSGLSEPELWELVRTQVAPRFTVPKTEADLRSDFGRVIAKIGERLGPPRRSSDAPAIPAGPLEDAPLTEFISTPIEWLWPSWLPRGVVTLMDGNPGVSKSTLVADLVARITTGREWPDGTSADGRIGRVMWITTEDDPGRVLRPRIEAAGGNAGLVRFVISEVVFPSAAGAFRELAVQRASEPEGLALVVLDPLFSHIEASVRTIADAEMRRGVMNPLGDAAEAADVAILVVRHFSKDTAASAVNRGAGSLGGIVGAARALWSVTVDPEDETGETKAIGVAKLNYARTPPALRYQVVDRVPPGWVTGTVSGIEWKGQAPVSINQILSDTPASRDAQPVLASLLQNGSMQAEAVYQSMRSRGFSRDATRSAKARLGIHAVKTGFTAGWTWSLPELTENAQVTELTELTEATSSPLLRIPRARDRGQGRGRGATPPSDSSVSWGEGDTGPTDGTDGRSGTDGALPAPAPAREGPTIHCFFFNDHQTSHRQVSPGVWICPTCDPEGSPA